MARWVPAITIQAMLEAFRVLGLDERRLRSEANVPEQPLEAGELLPDGVRQRLWASAQREAGREELALEAGLALPFGALGLLDYLAASADTLGACCEALARHFHRFSCARYLEAEASGDEFRLALVSAEARDETPEDDFALGVLLGRLRPRVAGFSLSTVRLGRAAPASAARFAELMGAPVSFGHAVAMLCLPAALREAPLSSADPRLRRTLESLRPERESKVGSTLERSLRRCLREMLPGGRLSAANVAGALGMSERSLHRRLREMSARIQARDGVTRAADLIEGVARK